MASFQLKEINTEELYQICNGRYTDDEHKAFYTKVDGKIKVVNLYYCSFKETIVFKNNNYDWTLLFHDCVFEKDIYFMNGTFNGSVLFQTCRFNGSLEFNNGLFNRYVDIRDCITSKEILLFGGMYKDDFDIKINGEKEALPIINIQGGQYQKLSIGGGQNDTELEVLEIAAIGIKGNIFIHGYNKLDDRKNVVHNEFTTKIHNLFIYHFSTNLVLYMESFNVNKVSVSSFSNSQKFKIHNIKVLSLENLKSEFNIQNSNLGVAEISNVNLDEFDDVNIRDSYISDTNFVNTTWPDTITSYDQKGNVLLKDIKDKKRYYFKNRDVYRQLKYSSNKYGDIVISQFFHSKEMSVYLKALDIKKQFGTWLILFLSKWTSNFGQSVRRPLVSLIIGHYVLFLAAIMTNALVIGHDWYCYLITINPIHSIEIFKKEETIIIDILMRIWSSYMIYNFIRASRRFIT